MNTDRRGFLSRLVGSGATLTTLSALQAIAPEAQAIEIKRDRRYVFLLRKYWNMETIHRMEEVLQNKGINATVIAADDLKIFEINQP
jgi:hypothetical protein